jgi:hypothetical protein
MDWLSAALALVGALGGVLLGNRLDRATRSQRERRQRLDDAARSVAATIAAKSLSTHVQPETQPRTVTQADIDEVARKQWLEGVEQYFVQLRATRVAVALLVADGIDVDKYWRDDETTQTHLEEVLELLLAQQRLGTRTRSTKLVE